MIVATIGLAQGAFTQSLFTMIVTMAVVTTSLMPPTLRRALAGLPIGKEERERLEREEVDAKGFIASLERLLLAVDTSAAGRLAARLAGLMAGMRGIPLTIVELPGRSDDASSATTREAVESGLATSAASLDQEKGTEPSRQVDISERRTDQTDVAEYSKKGFGLLFVGVEKSRTPQGHFSQKLSQTVRESQATLALLVADGASPLSLPETGTRILVPVTGTATSRQGAEIAFVLARALEGSATALYISRWPANGKGYGTPRLSTTRRSEEAVLRDIVRLAGRYDIDIRTAVEAHASPEVPILWQAAHHDLIVMGVDRRPGDTLFLGNTAAVVLRQCQCPILFIAA